MKMSAKLSDCGTVTIQTHGGPVAAQCCWKERGLAVISMEDGSSSVTHVPWRS